MPEVKSTARNTSKNAPTSKGDGGGGASGPAVKRQLLYATLAVALLVAAYLILRQTSLASLLHDGRELKATIRGFGSLGPAVVIALMTIAVVFNPLPSAPIALAAGALYGHTAGTIYIVIGAEFGAISAFLIARTAGYELVRRHFGDMVLLGRFSSQNSLTMLVFASRLIPFMSFDLVSYGAGLTPLRLWRFALATLFGLLPMSFALAHFGSEIATTGSGEDIARIALWLGLLVAIPLVLACILRRGRTPANDR